MCQRKKVLLKNEGGGAQQLSPEARLRVRRGDLLRRAGVAAALRAVSAGLRAEGGALGAVAAQRRSLRRQLRTHRRGAPALTPEAC